jgi:hypothetical protein
MQEKLAELFEKRENVLRWMRASEKDPDHDPCGYERRLAEIDDSIEAYQNVMND